MKKILLLVLAISLMVASCATSSYSQTGKAYPELPEDTHVDVIMRAVPDYKVEQIGIVKISGGTLDMQIKKAKKVALKKGGNVLILAEVGTGVSSQPNYSTGGTDVSTYDIRTFEVARKIEE